MPRSSLLLPLLLLVLPALAPQPLRAQGAPAPRGRPLRETLDIYYVDTEGGQATLFVTPAGQSVLVDTGNPGERDVGRILAAARAAGVDRLDFVLLTHYHRDHVGGLRELAARIPIDRFVDHGPTVETPEQIEGFQAAYAGLHDAAQHRVVRPGDTLPLPGVEWRIVSAAGRVIDRPLAGAGGPNAACPSTPPAPARDTDENAQSTGSVITFGRFRTVDLGDLLARQEYDMVCPVDRIGAVDLYLTSHHGLATSGSAALVHALRPRVAVMNNGTRKGGAADAFEILERSPGLEDLWQLHWSYNAGLAHNRPAVFIANPDDAATTATVITGSAGDAAGSHEGPAALLHVSARTDGSFTVTNTRNGFTKTYGPRR